jgi:outer membrane protein OmpA-like peptidoglycan-associated protein
LADVVAEALLGPPWPYPHWHPPYASAPYPWWCDGDHTFEDGGEPACADDAYAHEGEHTWDDDPDRDPYPSYPDAEDDPLATGAPAASDVLFEADSVELTPGARAELRRVAELVRGDPGLEILLRGHSDGSGEEGFDVSDARARSVRGFLAEQGVPPRRIAWVGLGDSRPLAPVDSADGRRRNRRVEIVVREREPDPYSG